LISINQARNFKSRKDMVLRLLWKDGYKLVDQKWRWDAEINWVVVIDESLIWKWNDLVEDLFTIGLSQ